MQKKQESGLFNDIPKLAKAIVADPPDSDSFITHVTLGGGLPIDINQMPMDSPIVRMNPLIRPDFNNNNNSWRLPNDCSSTDFKKLIELDLAVIDQPDVLLVDAFCNGWMAGNWPNQPIRHGSDGSPFCELGDPTFPSARARW